MSTLTIRMPEAKHERIKLLAQQRQISVNKLIEELTTIALAQHDASTRMALRAARGDPALGLRLLDKADAAFTKRRKAR